MTNAMKIDRLSPVGRVTQWLEAPSPPHTLVLATTCGCDLSRLERMTCEAINTLHEFEGCGFTCLDFNEVRHLAGQPGIRQFVAERAGLDAERLAHWNDHDLVLRGFAALGGLVLAGATALEATSGLDNVCRLMLSECGHCRDDDLAGLVEPHHRHLPQEFIDDVMEQFNHWLADEKHCDWNPRERLLEHRRAAALCS